MPSTSVWLLACSLSAQAIALPSRHSYEASNPTVQLANGTIQGRYAPEYDQDYFLGIPFAQPPVGDLRFRHPQPLSEAWEGSRNTTEYGPQCIGYGQDTWSQGNYISEDCLTLNVVRPKDCGQENLPVVVWIHGGGLRNGGSSDNRYNQSFIVHEAAVAGNPIIAVSINYRLASWGFLYGQAIQDSGNSVLGFRDQRIALRWVKENIGAFGGDPKRVTIWGQSGGGRAVSSQLVAFGGKDEELFSGAIIQAGAPVTTGAFLTLEDWELIVANISRETGCDGQEDLLACLRQVPTEELSNVFNSSATSDASYGAVLDGDWFQTAPSDALVQGDYVDVPILIGCNSDEGPGNIDGLQPNTTTDMVEYLEGNDFDEETIGVLAALYPDIPQIGRPDTISGRPGADIGLQFKRVGAVANDLGQDAGRRWSAQKMSEHGTKVYTYVFNVLVNGQPWYLGSTHFQEVAFVFYNTEGVGYGQHFLPNPMGGPERPKYLELAQQMTRRWISFVNFADPNEKLGMEAEYWPVYDNEKPQVFWFDQNVTSTAIPDLFRAEGEAYIGQLIEARAGTNCSGIAACEESL